MRKVLIGLVRLYQRIPGPWHNCCRYTPTCSEYMIGCLEEYGVFKGLYLGIKRILRCNPWGGSGYDPVPKKEDK